MIPKSAFSRAISWFLLSWVIAVPSVAVSQTAVEQKLPALGMTSENHLGLTFSGDGATAYWVAWNGQWGNSTASPRIIYLSRRQHGVWSEPAPAPFSGHFSDDDPFVSPDGRWLYFVSERPADEHDEILDADIWRYSLVDQNRLERLSINSESAEYSPVVTESGALYFASTRAGGMGGGDLYRAVPMGSSFQTPERLGAAINSPTGEWNAWISADDSEIIFEASSRATNITTPGDLYYSWRTPWGWTAAVPLEALNSPDSDLMPRLHPDGETLYYTTAPIGEHARVTSSKWSPLRKHARTSYAPILLVASQSWHEIAIVNLTLGEVSARDASGDGPKWQSNVSDSDGSLTTAGLKWVSDATDGSIAIVDRRTSTVVEKIESVCGSPTALSQDSKDRVWIACFASAELVSIDRDNFSIRQRISLLDQPINLLIHPERALAYVSLPGQSAIAEISLEAGTELRRIPVGFEPDGLQWVPPDP